MGRAVGDKYPGARKVGYFQSEKPFFDEIEKGLGLTAVGKPYSFRHPLAFLVEAADDICYTIVDVEDGYELGYLTFEETKEALEPIAKATFTGLAPSEVIAKLRAASIRRLVKDAADAFISHETQLLRGTFNEEILNLTPASVDLEKALTLAMVKLYRSDDKTKLELAGERIIHGLLTDFMSAVSDLAKVEFDISRLGRRSGQIARVIGRPLQSVASTYEATLVVTDFISAMTDRFALQLYRSLNGIDI